MADKDIKEINKRLDALAKKGERQFDAIGNEMVAVDDMIHKFMDKTNARLDALERKLAALEKK